ncbi:hypothetical protein LSCM1_07965 [Leishmania martiniquensis]|uniref:Basic immunoglobulin-like variable motif-containing protein n=1 Tax=Leishmania martiniquensis TaxID=1580590 RepID=A0A836KTS8_9TRYP|nr:hypothetical protein LSCM1_07965 [Leishmania martiniquensis]
MDHRSADSHDAAGASEMAANGAAGAPDTTAAAQPLSPAADVATPAHEGLLDSANEGDSSTGYDVCEVRPRSPAFLPLSAARAASSRLGEPTGGASMALPSAPAFVEVEGVDVRTPPHIYATKVAESTGSAASLKDDCKSAALRISSAEARADTTAAAEVGDSEQLHQQQGHQPVNGTASGPCDVAATPVAAVDSQVWVIDFAPLRPMPTRKMTRKERDTIRQLRQRGQTVGTGASTATMTTLATGGSLGADSEGNVVVTHGASTSAASLSSALRVMSLDTLAVAREELIPTSLTTTRADLEARLVLRLPRLLCVNKQYPRGCGIASLASVYNYLYSWLGESAVGANRAPHSQEEIMSILGFEPPFGEIAWGPFTGNATLIRWFHALNRHFGLRGRAYILYKAHGSGKTTHLYADNAEALTAVKAALRDPHCALIYHCYNHYMVPIGYQDIPLAQTDFLKPAVPESSCETTIFVGEVSRGRHEALYARKWSQIVKDIECKSPFFFNIRHPEQGVQRREPKKKLTKGEAGEGAGGAAPHATTAAAAAAKAEMGEVDGWKGLQQEWAGQKRQDESSSEAHSAAETVLIAPPAAHSRSSTAVLRNINDEGVDADELDDAARSSSSRDTIEVVDFAAVATPSLPSLSKPQKLSKSSSSSAVLTTVVPEPDFAEAPQDAAGNLSITTVLQPSAVAAGDGVAAQPSVNCGADTGAPPAAQSAPLSPIEAPGAHFADNAVTSTSEAVCSVPAPLPPPASPSSRLPLPHQPRPGTAHGETVKTTEAPRSTQRAPLPPRPKRERGNLHCIICFRNDEVEPHLERYEDTPVPLPDKATAPSCRSLSSVSRGGSSSSDADNV